MVRNINVSSSYNNLFVYLQVCDSPGTKTKSQKSILGFVDNTVEPFSPGNEIIFF